MCIVTGRVLNLAALGFTIIFSGALHACGTHLFSPACMQQLAGRTLCSCALCPVTEIFMCWCHRSPRGWWDQIEIPDWLISTVAIAALRYAVLCCAVGFLMLAVNWSAIHAECLMPHERTHSCDLLAVAIHKHPFRDHSHGLVSREPLSSMDWAALSACKHLLLARGVGMASPMVPCIVCGSIRDSCVDETC